MSLSFRNLVLFALFAVLISSLSISSNAPRDQNQHKVRIHESTIRSAAHQQASTTKTTFGQNILKIVDDIAKSVQPSTPSIIPTSALTTFAYDRNTCESLTDDQKKQIAEKVKSTKASITTFKTNVKDNKLLIDADNSIQYLDTIQSLTNSSCSTLTTYLLIGPTPFQTNINTKKSWVLGGLTMDNLVKDYINRITVNNNVTNCGENTPFWNGLDCIACNDPKPIFNMSASECTACPTGKVFDLKTKTCIDGQAPAPKAWKPNPAAESKALVPAGTQTDALPKYLSTGSDVCPTDKPNVKDNTCIACPTDKPYFNIVSKACEACPTGATYNTTSHQCISAAKQYKPNAAAETKVIVQDGAPKDALKTYMNTGTEPCPTDKPFVKDNACIPCPTDKPYFNIVAKECQKCPLNYVLDTATHKCILGKPIATDVSLHTPRLVMNEDKTSADWDNYVKENEDKMLCPSDTPFWNGTKCIQCPDLFNVSIKECDSCEAGLTLHENHKCEVADPLNPRLEDLGNIFF